MRFLKPVHIFHKKYIPMKRWGYTIFAALLFTVTQYESQWNPITNVRLSYCTVKLVKHHKIGHCIYRLQRCLAYENSFAFNS